MVGKRVSEKAREDQSTGVRGGPGQSEEAELSSGQTVWQSWGVVTLRVNG